MHIWDRLYETGKPLVVLISSGRPLIIGEYKNKADSIMYIWQLGTCTGRAVAKNLFGICNPSGHLTVSVPCTEGQIPVNYNHPNTGHPPLGRVWYESKYIDSPIEPDYCFGFGLSYTTFQLSDLKLSTDKITSNGVIRIDLKVKNIGNCDGKAVIQLYVNDVTASIVRPVKELKRFKKISIKAGETIDTDFTISGADLGFYNNQGKFLIEPGKFKLYIGQSSCDNSLSAEFYII